MAEPPSDEPRPSRGERAPETPVAHPNAPSGAAVLLAFVGVLIAGALGGIIGWGVSDASCTGSCGPWLLGGSLLGAVLTAAGAGIVAALLLRSMSEWRTHRPG